MNSGGAGLTTAARLREARENAYWPDFVPGNTALSRAILDAIDIALPILGADPELVNRLASVLIDQRGDDNHEVEVWERAEAEARELLAAISTPTLGGQE